MSDKYKKIEVTYDEYEALRDAGVWTHFVIHYALQEGRPYSDSVTFYTRVELEQDE